MTTITGLAFPGGRRAELTEFEIAEPAPNEVRIAVKASGICGSDLHTYDSEQGLRDRGTDRLLVAGHEPAGVIESVGEAVTDFAVGDRVLAYHIMGCGNCTECRRGYPVVCTSPRRAAYGGERDGGHAPLLLVEQHSLIRIPDDLSFVDGAMIACGVGTAYSAILKSGVRAGQTLLVTGLGPVGLAVTQLASAMGVHVIGSDLNPDRVAAAQGHGLSASVDGPGAADQIAKLTHGAGVHAAIDCTGAAPARMLCIESAGIWGTVIFVGVGRGELSFDPTIQLIVKQLTLRGSWVSSLAEMEELTHVLVRLGIRPETLVSETFALENGVAAYEHFADGAAGKMVFRF